MRRCSSSPPVENIALFPVTLQRLAVTVHTPQDADMSYGDQAGILLYACDCKWVKLVVEGDKTPGSRMVVLALMPSNAEEAAQGMEAQAAVSHKWSLDHEAPRAIRLQLELLRGDGHCSVTASHDGCAPVQLSAPFDCARLGVMGHLCKQQQPSPRQRWFQFSEFSSGTSYSA